MTVHKTNWIALFMDKIWKIEEGEIPKDTAVREFREEAGLTVLDPEYAGNLIVEYPDRIYDFTIFVATKYKKEQIQEIDGLPEFIEKDNLLKKEKLFAEIYLLDKNHYNDLINKPTIGDALVHFYKNNDTWIKTINVNATNNTTVNIPIPTTVSELTNDKYYLEVPSFTSFPWFTSTKNTLFVGSKIFESNWVIWGFTSSRLPISSLL